MSLVSIVNTECDFNELKVHGMKHAYQTYHPSFSSKWLEHKRIFTF